MYHGTPVPGSVLDFSLPGGFTWRFQFTGAPSVEHHMLHPDLAEPVWLGRKDTYHFVPILAWHEARRVIGAVAGPVPECFVLSLFLPVVNWSDADEDELRELLRGAWTRTGMLDPDKVDVLIDRLTQDPDEDEDEPPAAVDVPLVTGAVPRYRKPEAAEAIGRMLAAIGDYQQRRACRCRRCGTRWRPW